MSERLCPLCGKPLETGASPVSCPRCYNLFHAECWASIDRCVAFGCNFKEGGAPLLAKAPKVVCSKCGHQNSEAARICLNCGEQLWNEPERNCFVSFAGWRAQTPEELLKRIDASWDAGVKHLYWGDLEYWFAKCGRQDWADKAKKARETNPQHSIGLESFLQSVGGFAQPQPVLSKESVLIEVRDSVVEDIIDVRNTGRGYLSGKVESDSPWLILEEDSFAGNSARFIYRVEPQDLKSGRVEGRITFHFSTNETKSVAITVRKAGIASAVQAFSEGDTAKARNVCRRFLDSSGVGADAAILTCACYLREDNEYGAVSVLRRVSGLCSELPSEVVEEVFNWLEKDDPATANVDRFAVYDAMLSCFNEEKRAEVKKLLARLALDKASLTSDAIGSGASAVWQSGRSADEGVHELLDVACEYDPSLKDEAKVVRSNVKGRNTRKSMVNVMWLLIFVAFIAGIIWGSMAYLSSQTDHNVAMLTKLINEGRYSEAVDKAKELQDGNSEVGAYRLKLIEALIGLAQQEYAKNYQSHLAAKCMYDASNLAVKKEQLECLSISYQTWASKLMEDGLKGEARVIIEKALSVDPKNTAALSLKAQISSETEQFWQIFCFVQKLGTHELNASDAKTGSYVDDIKMLERLGVTFYKRHTRLFFADVIGNKSRELVVAGTDGNNDSKGQGKCAVYDMGPRGFTPLYSNSYALSPVLRDIACGDVSGEGRNDLFLRWSDGSESASFCTRAIACRQGKFVEEVVPSKAVIDVADHGKSGRCQIWIPEVVADSTEPVYAVSIYKPFAWGEPGFTPASGNYSEYYKGCIEALQAEIKENPYHKSDKRSVAYTEDRNKAIGVMQKLISGGKTR